MINVRLSQVKQMFFDRQAVLSAVSRAERRVLSKYGAFVRTTARSSIRKRKKAAPPGMPPSSHTGLLKRNIFFAFEPERRSVVIGPIRLNAKNTDAPATLEHGGMTTIVRRRKGRTIAQKVDVDARPYMGPAAEKERQKLPALWAGAVK